MTAWKEDNKFVKVWKDEGELKAGFFNSDNTLLEEIPLQDLNNSEPEEIAKEMAEAHNIRVQAGYGVDFEIVQGNYEAIEENTLLAEREAELYILTEELGYNVRQAAEQMNISEGNARKKRNRIKNKVQEARRTAELEI